MNDQGALYQLCSIAGLPNGAYVLIDGPYDKWGQIITTIKPGIKGNSRFATRYLIRGVKNRAPTDKNVPFAAN